MSIELAIATGQGAEILLRLFVILISAKIMAEVFERLRQPAIIGEILAGVFIGPSVLNLVAPSEITSTFAEIGVIGLLFTVGLETKPSAIFRVGKLAVVVAVSGVATPFLGGWLLMRMWGNIGMEAMFIGTAMVATSVGITARILSAMELLDAPTSRVILGAAVIDDILGLLVLGVVSSMVTGAVDYIKVGVTAILAIGFTLFIALVGTPLLTQIIHRIERLRVKKTFFLFGLMLCLGLSVAATYIGMAAIIGAFLAGMALAEAMEGNHDIHLQTAGVTEFFAPFFLVNIGMHLKLDVFRDISVLALALLVTLIAVVTKLIGCGAGAWQMGFGRAAQVGMGMVPRSEVGIIVAQIGLSLAILTDALYGVVLFMAVATTLIAPPILKILFASEVADREGRTPADAGRIVAKGDLSKIG